MAKSKTIVRSIALQGASPLETLHTSNELLSLDNASCMFVTIFYAILDTSTGLLTYANAGHNPPYIVSHNNVVKKVPVSETIALGIDPVLIKNNFPKFQQHTIPLKDRDFIFLYTDGVTEAMNSKGDLYTNSRLEEVLAHAGEKPLNEVIDSTLRDIKTFTGFSEQSDDIAILCTRYYQEQHAHEMRKPTTIEISDNKFAKVH